MKIISLGSLRIFLTATVFLLTGLPDLEHATSLQDQDQGRPRTTRMHCGRMG